MAAYSPPELSQNFFQAFLEEKVPEGYTPVLQVLETRLLNPGPIGQKSYRTRLSDGIFSYSGCSIACHLSERFETEGLTSHNGIIRVLSFNRANNTGLKPCLTVADYELVSIDYPIIGNPLPHTGRPEDYMATGTALATQKILPTQVKNEPENFPESPMVKRARPVSPPAESRQPLRKRLPSNPGRLGITPIAVITPFVGKWRIRGIVSQKEPLKEVTNAKGTFKISNFVISDETGTSIRITGFGDQATKCNDIIHNGETFYISGDGRFTVRSANKRFNSTGHDYEITLDKDSQVEPADIALKPPPFKLHPVPLSEIGGHLNERIDVLAVVDRAEELTQVTQRKDQTQLDKRNIFLIDQSATEVCLTLWSEQAANFDAENVGKVVGVNGAIVKEFNGGLSLSVANNSVIKVNPDGVATNNLYLWHRDKKPGAQIKSISSTSGGDAATSFERDFRFIGIINEVGVDQDNEKGNYYTVKGLITNIKTENAIYQACPTEKCKKKVTMENNQYRCEKCNSTFATCKNLVMLQVEISDFTGSAWITVFDERAEHWLSTKAETLYRLQKEDNSEYNAVFQRVRFREYIFRVGIRNETYNDQTRLRWSVFDIRPVSSSFDRCRKLLKDIIEEEQNRIRSP